MSTADTTSDLLGMGEGAAAPAPAPAPEPATTTAAPLPTPTPTPTPTPPPAPSVSNETPQGDGVGTDGRAEGDESPRAEDDDDDALPSSSRPFQAQPAAQARASPPPSPPDGGGRRRRSFLSVFDLTDEGRRRSSDGMRSSCSSLEVEGDGRGGGGPGDEKENTHRRGGEGEGGDDKRDARGGNTLLRQLSTTLRTGRRSSAMNSSASGGEDRDFGGGGQQGGILRQLSMNIKSSVARRRSSALSSAADDDTPFERDMTRLAKYGEDSPLGPSMSGPPCPRPDACCRAVSRECRSFSRVLRTARSHPRILLYALLAFSAISAAGLTAIIVSGKNERDEAARDLAEEGREAAFRIDDELKKALLPLFTMQEMATQNEAFRTLAAEVREARTRRTTGSGGGDGGVDGGVDFASGDFSRVNVTGVCDDVPLRAEYDRIAKSVKESADMPRVLVNVRLDPDGVVCMPHPLNNTADFGDGAYLDSAAYVGKDLLAAAGAAGAGGDGRRRTFSMASPPEDETILVDGPYRPSFINGTDARILTVHGPVFVDAEGGGDDGVAGAGAGADADRTANGEFWGYATVLLNWDRIESDLDLAGFFERRDMEFRLVHRAEEGAGGAEEEEAPEEMVISQSENSHLLTSQNSIVEPLTAFDSGWVLVMGEPSSTPIQLWVIWGCVAVLLVAILSSLALIVILVAKHEHELLLYRMMPKKIIRKLQHGETVVEKYDDATLCFFDIVSFTTISGAMKAEEVMNMLRVLYTEFDRLAERHGVFNVETIGDAYIVIGGGPDKCSPEMGAAKVASFALDAIEATRNLRFDDGWRIEIRAGLASGLVVAGVIGTELVPKLTLFGTTVTLGEALEAGSEAMKVQGSAETYRLLRKFSQSKATNAEGLGTFQLRRRDDGKTFRVEGKKISETYWIDGVVRGGARSESEKPLVKSMQQDEEEDQRQIENIDFVDSRGNSNGNGNGADPQAEEEGPGGADEDVDEFNDEENLVDVDLDGPPSAAPNGDGKRRHSNGHSGTVGAGDNGRRSAESSTSGKRRSSFSVIELLEAHDEREEGSKGGGSKGGGNISSGSLSNRNSSGQDSAVNLEKSMTALGGRSWRTKKKKKAVDGDDDDVCSATSTTSSALQDYWSKLGDDVWLDVNAGEGERRESSLGRCWSAFCSFASRKAKHLRQIAKICAGRKRIVVVTFITFAALCAAGLATVLVFARDYEENLQGQALSKAEDADRWLLKELRKSLLPLFAMAELTKDLGRIFDDMPERIENRTVLKNVRPFWWRNTTGICDAPEKLKPFNEMAASIKKRSDLKRILVNIQLAPHGVLCLTHPKNNTEDFDDGAFLDTSFAIGLDLINDPTRSAVSRATVKEDRYTIQGPIPLVQGKKSVVDEAIIARYPIRDPDHFIDIDGTNYSFWGHSVTLMDWDKLKKKFGLNEFFAKDDMEYKMTRTDTVVNSTTGEKSFKVAIIAESERSSVLTDDNSVSVELQTADNGWVLTAGYESGFSPAWKVGGCVLVVLASLLLSSLLLMVLVTTTEHELLLYRMMPPGVVKRLQKGETIVDRDSLATVFFSHIVGFTALSGEMKPADFMLMLNQIYEAFDRLTIKHGVSKVETLGACYIVTAPGPENCVGREGAVRVALFALDAMDFVRNYRYNEKQIFIKAGIASGPMVSGVIGAAVPKYTIFGDTVNFASRMDSTGRAQMIQCSEKTQQLLKKSTEFNFRLEERFENGVRGIEVKGKGLKFTWWIHGAESVHGDNFGSGHNIDLGVPVSDIEIGGGTRTVDSVSPDPKQVEDPNARRGRRVSFSEAAVPGT